MLVDSVSVDVEELSVSVPVSQKVCGLFSLWFLIVMTFNQIRYGVSRRITQLFRSV